MQFGFQIFKICALGNPSSSPVLAQDAPAIRLAAMLAFWPPFCNRGVHSNFLASILPFLLPCLYSMRLAYILAAFFYILHSWHHFLSIHFCFLALMWVSWFPLQPLRLLRPPRPCLRLPACCLILLSWHPFRFVGLNSVLLAYILPSWHECLLPGLHVALLASMLA